MERIRQQLEEARKQQEQLQYGPAVSTGDARHQKRGAFRPAHNRLHTLKDSNVWLLPGMIVVIASVMIVWWTGSDQQQDGTRLSSLRLPESHQTSATGSQAIERLEARLGAVIERMEKLTNSVSSLESRLITARMITDSTVDTEQKLVSSTAPELPVNTGVVQDVETLPPPAAGIIVNPENTTVIAASTAKTPPLQQQRQVPEAPAAREQSSVSDVKDGPWVINLASLPSKSDADRLTEKARSRDIQTELQRVTVKGNQYWRVQITGFSTAEEARTYANIATEKLGLKDAWIMKR